MEGLKLENFIGKKVTVWLLGQAQLNISPGMVTHGTLEGIDQGIYIIRRMEESGKSTGEIMLVPMGQCRISLKE